MKRKSEAGFSLVEVLVAIALLGIVVIPTCSALVMSFRMNAKTDEMMQAQLAVSSAVETLMAEGIEFDSGENPVVNVGEERFPDVTIVLKSKGSYYSVVVTSKNVDSVSVSTHIRTVAAATEEGGGGT